MSPDRAYRVHRTAQQHYAEIGHMAKLCGQTQDEILARRRQVLDGLPKGTPRWVQAQLAGYWERMRQEWDRATVFGYTYEGVVYFVTRQAKALGLPSTEDLAALIGWPAISDLPGAFYWGHTCGVEGKEPRVYFAAPARERETVTNQ